jgi:transcriptional regulator with XRE-family HTH domain
MFAFCSYLLNNLRSIPFRLQGGSFWGQPADPDARTHWGPVPTGRHVRRQTRPCRRRQPLLVCDILCGTLQVPDLKKLTRLAAALNVEVAWLLTGKGGPQDDDPIDAGYHNELVAIQHAGARRSMGGGAVIKTEDTPGRGLHFLPAWIRDRLKAAPSMLRVM